MVKENLDMPFRGDESSRRNSEIKIKIWKKDLGTASEKFSENRIKLVTWSLVSNLSPNGQVCLGGGAIYGGDLILTT